MADYNASDNTRQPGLGERVAELLPGTAEHAAKHNLPHSGDTQSLGATVASYIPGTVEYNRSLQQQSGTGLATDNTAGYTGSNVDQQPRGLADTQNTGVYASDNYVTDSTNPAGGYSTSGARGTGLSDLTDVQAALPGTEERRNYTTGAATGDVMGSGSDAAYGTTGTDYNTTGTGAYTGTDTRDKPTVGERIKSAVPGTDEYEGKHGYDRNQDRAEKVKSYIPGTEENKEKKAYDSTGTGMTGTGMGGDYSRTGAGAGDYTGTGAYPTADRDAQPAPAHLGAGSGATGMESGRDYTTSETYTGTGTNTGLTAGTEDRDYSRTGGAMTGTDTYSSDKPTMTERVKQMVPGTDEYEEKHGHDRKQERAENAKSYLPGTEEHRMKKEAQQGTEGYTTTDTGMTGAMVSGEREHLAGGFGTGGLVAQYAEPTYQGVPLTSVDRERVGTEGYDTTQGSGYGTAGAGTEGMSMGDKIKSKVPGTDEYEEVHGADKRHMQAENLKSKVPGTDEYKERKADERTGGYTDTGAAGYGTTTGATGAGYGTTTGYDSTPGAGTGTDLTTTEVEGATYGKTIEGGATYDTTPGDVNTGYSGDADAMRKDLNLGTGDYDVERSRDQDPMPLNPLDKPTGGGEYHSVSGPEGATAATGYDYGYSEAAGEAGTAGQKEGLGHKIAKHIPGTTARKEYKAEKAGMADATY